MLNSTKILHGELCLDNKIWQSSKIEFYPVVDGNGRACIGTQDFTDTNFFMSE